MTYHQKPRYFVIMPAAGIGRRMQSDLPKQYISVQGKTIIEHALTKFISHQKIEKIIVAISSRDFIWQQLQMEHYFDKVISVQGGIQRCHSVLNGLKKLSEFAEPYDWVLVHDAVRPCLRGEDIDRLIEQISDHPVGGILGARVRDTLKQANEVDQIVTTMERNNIWQAFTPQMFRFNLLMQALQTSVNRGRIVTDEAQAIEALGLIPLMIEGRRDNIKLTSSDDLSLIEKYLN